MIVPASIMLDTIGRDWANIPRSTHYVGAYVSGLDIVPWPANALASFPESRIVRIYQGVGDSHIASSYDAIDVESRAVTPVQAAAMVAERVNANIMWTTVYGTDSTLAAVTTEIRKYGDAVWNGHVNYWLADWDLNQAQATALLGSRIHGASCVAVQWASPSSNPNTITPGGSLPLRQSNVDISVVDANWVPSGPFTGNTPPPPPSKVFNGILVTTDETGTFVCRHASSTDDAHWQA